MVLSLSSIYDFHSVPYGDLILAIIIVRVLTDK